MKIALITIATANIENYARYTRLKNSLYCEKNGITFIEYKTSLEPKKNIMWSKILALLENIEKFDYLFWVDADAMILNAEKKLSTFIKPDKDFYFSFDENGLNAGVFLLKCGEFSKRILKQVYALHDKFDSHMWKEQEALKSLYYSDHEFTRRVAVLDKREFNSYLDDYETGDFILHLPGAPWWFHKDRQVGNGGFSLRSKRLMKWCAENIDVPAIAWEDCLISRDYHDRIVKAGFVFAPVSVAEKFSIENGVWSNQFGFHDKRLTDIRAYKTDAKTATFYGNAGDVIHAVPVLKAMQVERIVLNPRGKMPGVTFSMDNTLCRMLVLLLEKQGFAVEVKNATEGILFEKFRENKTDLKKMHIIELMAKTFGVSANEKEKYLSVPPIHKADIIVNRTARYRNSVFDWRSLLIGHETRAAFIGTLKEYFAFQAETGVRIRYEPTINFYHAAQVIAGAKLFIGNQSACDAIAEGLQVMKIQETDVTIPTCQSTVNACNVLVVNDNAKARAFLTEALKCSN